MSTHSNGKVTAYGFACGYVEKVETDSLEKEMYREHGVYHVRSTKNNTPEANTDFTGGRSHKFIVWESFDTLGEARKFFNKIK